MKNPYRTFAIRSIKVLGLSTFIGALVQFSAIASHTGPDCQHMIDYHGYPSDFCSKG